MNLRALLTRLDPDLPLPLNRDPDRGVLHKKEGSYFSYGQIIYRGKQILLYGRCHIDCRNAMMWQDYDLEGALETARITALLIQTAARVSPGTGISSMQITTALRNDILVPWRKQQAERPKTAADLIRFDKGGLVYQPITALAAVLWGGGGRPASARPRRPGRAACTTYACLEPAQNVSKK